MSVPASVHQVVGESDGDERQAEQRGAHPHRPAAEPADEQLRQSRAQRGDGVSQPRASPSDGASSPVWSRMAGIRAPMLVVMKAWVASAATMAPRPCMWRLSTGVAGSGGAAALCRRSGRHTVPTGWSRHPPRWPGPAGGHPRWAARAPWSANQYSAGGRHPQVHHGADAGHPRTHQQRLGEVQPAGLDGCRSHERCDHAPGAGQGISARRPPHHAPPGAPARR